MGFVHDFRDFAIKGNVFDLAIGVIMGGAFGKIVSALIDHLISPILGMFGGINFSEMYVMIGKVDKVFTEAVKKADGTIDTAAKAAAEVAKNPDGTIQKAYAVMLTNPNGSTMSYADAKTHGPALGYGAFLTETINFLIMAFVVFLMVKAYTAARKRFENEKPAPAPAPIGPSEKDYLKEIRDLLARK